MTHLRTKRTRARTLVTAFALAAAFLVPTAPGAASAATGPPESAGPQHSATPRGWSDTPHGFASLAGGTTGGRGGKVVTVSDQAGLMRYAAAEEPYIIRVAGSIAVEPVGSDIDVTSDKTIVGVGTTGEIVHGELHLNPGTSNVVIRNLTIRDSSPSSQLRSSRGDPNVEGDWDGKSTDFDAIQMDSADHVWIDHNRLTHMGDGLLDVRKDSQYVTVSYNHFDNHNKAIGIGWTDDVKTQITIDHNWFSGTKQRNPSADDCAYAHLYNNYLSAQVADGDPLWTYGNWARGGTKMVIENSYYRDVQHPYQADATAELVQRGSVLENTTGRTDAWGDAFEPRDFYPYTLDPAADVPGLVTRGSGPQKNIGTDTVLRVPADYASVQSAVDAVPAGNDGRITVRLAPGTYREHVRIGEQQPYVSLVGTGRDRADTLIVFDTPSGERKPDGTTQGSWGSATVVVEGHDFTAENLTFSNDFDEAAVEISGEQALAVKTTGDRLTFRDTAFLGNQDTLMTDTPVLTQKARVYIRDSYIEGDVDFVYGRATTVIERSVIRALSRGSATNNGYITAASTWKDNPYGFLITRSRVISDAPADSYHLGRPWHPSGNPDAIGQVLFRETELPAAVKGTPWTNMSGFPWQEARFGEYRTYGPGAAVTADRPQMSAPDAAHHRVRDYLAGEDGWAPHRTHH